MVGKRNLERALKNAQPKLKSADVDVKVSWRPYMLKPASTWGSFPPEAQKYGINKREWYMQKFGPDRMAAIEPRLRQAFENAGIENFSMGGNTGPTMDAHRLVAYAETLDTSGDIQNALMEGLFSRYFTQERAPCDKEALLDACKEAGVTDAESVLEDSSKFLLDVEDQLRTYSRGVSGVPHFIISNGSSKRLQFGGAQPPETFEDAFEELLE
jgi:SWI/SNF related-matrix-associated actin-dependent regulator of chromatin subfamily C